MIPRIITNGSMEARAEHIANEFPLGKWIVTHITAEKTSILIDQIKDMLTHLTITSPIPRLIWIEEAQLMTIPAQNALLKILEEPPENTQFILSAPSAAALLETVRSRSRVTPIASTDLLPAKEGLDLLRTALSLTSGDRVVAADSLGKKRDECLTWCSSCLTALSSKARQDTSPKSLHITTTIGSLLEATIRDLKANISVSLTMQNLFLKLPRVIGQ